MSVQPVTLEPIVTLVQIAANMALVMPALIMMVPVVALRASLVNTAIFAKMAILVKIVNAVQHVLMVPAQMVTWVVAYVIAFPALLASYAMNVHLAILV